MNIKLKNEKDDYTALFYGEAQDGEELVDKKREIVEEDILPEDEGRKEIIEVIAVCEDCDNHWDDVIDAQEYNDYDYDSGFFCPQCGSSLVRIE